MEGCSAHPERSRLLRGRSSSCAAMADVVLQSCSCIVTDCRQESCLRAASCGREGSLLALRSRDCTLGKQDGRLALSSFGRNERSLYRAVSLHDLRHK